VGLLGFECAGVFTLSVPTLLNPLWLVLAVLCIVGWLLDDVAPASNNGLKMHHRRRPMQQAGSGCLSAGGQMQQSSSDEQWRAGTANRRRSRLMKPLYRVEDAVG
jgi:hypothetical protein